MEKAEKKGVAIHLPSDFVTADKFHKDAQVNYMYIPHSIIVDSVMILPVYRWVQPL